MPEKIDKVLVTNVSALKKKYKAAGWSAIKKGIRELVKADKARGLTTQLVALDDPVAMQKLAATAVVQTTDPQQNKLAIDGVYRALQPDYLVILGSPDVVPHQDLINPLPHVTRDEDPDPIVFSDLPYSSDKPYSQNVRDFVGPTRVVGRLPDFAGSTDPALLIALLGIAARHQSRPRSDYESCFGLSAKVWKASTALSVKNLFGPKAGVKLSPPNGPQWSDELLKRRSHFINCHGMKAISQFYGQQGKTNYPVAHETAAIEGRITEGTIVAAECCYGAELYAPGPPPFGPRPSICQTYLAGGAYGFFGSTTVAYGPADGNGQADLICQYFWRQIMQGASQGRAALESRHEFVKVSGTLDPTELKTLAQFIMLGDPSIQPVMAATVAGPKIVIKPVKGKSRASLAGILPQREAATSVADNRAQRRQKLVQVGTEMQRTTSAVIPESVTPSSKIQETLRQAMSEIGVTSSSFATFGVSSPSVPRPSGGRRGGTGAAMTASVSSVSAIHVAMGRVKYSEPDDETRPQQRQYAVVIAREIAGSLHVKKIVSR